MGFRDRLCAFGVEQRSDQEAYPLVHFILSFTDIQIGPSLAERDQVTSAIAKFNWALLFFTRKRLISYERTFNYLQKNV